MFNSPEDQLKKAKALNKERKWGLKASDFPKVPDFKPETDTEVLVLSINLPEKDGKSGVARTFDELWDAIDIDGHTKWRWDSLYSDNIRLFNREHTPGLRWVAYDPNFYWDKEKGRSPESLWNDKESVAASEALSAVLLNPDYVAQLDGYKVPYIDLAGYQFKYDNEWSDCPCLDRWVDGRRLGLSANWAGAAGPGWAAPRVREIGS